MFADAPAYTTQHSTTPAPTTRLESDDAPHHHWLQMLCTPHWHLNAELLGASLRTGGTRSFLWARGTHRQQCRHGVAQPPGRRDVQRRVAAVIPHVHVGPRLHPPTRKVMEGLVSNHTAEEPYAPLPQLRWVMGQSQSHRHTAH